MTEVDARVSLVMTVWNEEAGLEDFLTTLGEQEVLPREVVVVDGGSTDGTVAILRSWAAPAGVDVRIYEEPGANISQGRNAAIKLATREWVAVTDAGTTLESTWLQSLSRLMSDDVDVVCGWFEPLQTTFMGTTIAAVITPLRSEIDEAKFLPSSRSVAFRKDVWTESGGYPEWLDYCEDLVFDLAMKSGGARFVFAGDAIVKWSGRPDLCTFSKQYYRYARGDGKAGLWKKRHVIRYATYTTATGLVSAAVLTRSRWPVLLVLVGFTAYMMKFWKRVLRRPQLLESRWASLALTPVVVVTGDVAKMLGYPAGLGWRTAHPPDEPRPAAP